MSTTIAGQMRLDVKKDGIDHMTVDYTCITIHTANFWPGLDASERRRAAFIAKRDQQVAFICPSRRGDSEILNRRCHDNIVEFHSAYNIVRFIDDMKVRYPSIVHLYSVHNKMLRRGFVHLHQYALLMMHENGLLSRAQLHRAYVHLGQSGKMPDETCTSQQLLVS